MSRIAKKSGKTLPRFGETFVTAPEPSLRLNPGERRQAMTDPSRLKRAKGNSPIREDIPKVPPRVNPHLAPPVNSKRPLAPHSISHPPLPPPNIPFEVSIPRRRDEGRSSLEKEDYPDLFASTGRPLSSEFRLEDVKTIVAKTLRQRINEYTTEHLRDTIPSRVRFYFASPISARTADEPEPAPAAPPNIFSLPSHRRRKAPTVRIE